MRGAEGLREIRNSLSFVLVVKVPQSAAVFVEAGADHRFSAYERLSILVIFERRHAANLRSVSQSLRSSLGLLLGEQSLRECVADKLCARRQSKLLHDVGTVRLGRADRDVELVRNFLVGVPEGEES